MQVCIHPHVNTIYCAKLYYYYYFYHHSHHYYLISSTLKPVIKSMPVTMRKINDDEMGE